MKATFSSQCARLGLPVIATLVALLQLTVAESCNAASAPANDNLAAAQIIASDSFSLPGTEVGATQEGFEKDSNFPYYTDYDLDSSVWYSYTPNVSGMLKVGTKAGDGAAILLFTGPATPSTDTLLAETHPQQDFLPVVHVTALQTYFIFVGNEKVGAHPFVLNGTLKPDDGSVPAVIPTATLTAKKPTAVRSPKANGKVTIALSAPAPAELSITYSVKGTAVNGDDYAMLTGTVVVPAGASTVDLKIKPLPDLAGEGDKTVKLKLKAGDGYTVGTPAKAVVVITE